WTGLADCYVAQSGVIAPSEVLPKAKAAALRALDIDNRLGEAHASLGFISLHYEWDWPTTEKEYKLAIELNPSYATAHSMYARYLGIMKRFDEGVAQIKQAQQLDPLSPSISLGLGFQFYLAKQYAMAIEHYRKTIEMFGSYTPAHLNLGQAYLQQS